MGIKYQVNEDFFKKWTNEMAYTLGYIYADGSLEDASYLRGKYFKVTSVERKNIEKIRDWMNSKHTIIEIKPLLASRKTRYILRIGSHEIYNDLIKLGLYPNKSLTIKFPVIPKKFFGDFIRGYFDGDGCVRIWRTKGKKQELILRKLCTVFTSGSKEFLQGLADKVSESIGTNQQKVYDGHESYMLSYSTGDSVKLFKFMYGKVKKSVYLERKADIYKWYFELRPQRVDKGVKSVLQYIS